MYNEMKTLGKRIKTHRLDSGYTQRQVADRLSIDRSTYAYYEIGKRVPSLERLVALCELFETDPNTLLGF